MRVEPGRGPGTGCAGEANICIWYAKRGLMPETQPELDVGLSMSPGDTKQGSHFMK